MEFNRQIEEKKAVLNTPIHSQIDFEIEELVLDGASASPSDVPCSGCGCSPSPVLQTDSVTK
ncbi:MAG TPA: hypothetical protein VMW27_28865 [Thermoanaerobaculia bacterium]|nr:hypothetical protein [Thermoanaerobaculia bacterium]